MGGAGEGGIAVLGRVLGNRNAEKSSRKGKGASTYYKLSVKSPLIDAFNSISMSRFASSDNFNPSVSFSSLPFVSGFGI